MIYLLNNREVEIEIDRNIDGSRFIAAGYFIDNDQELSDTELDQLQDDYDGSEELNGNWRG